MQQIRYPALWLLIFTILIQFIACQSDTLPNNQSVSLPEKVDFNFHIKPILSDRCFKCHGPDEKTLKANLRLDEKEHAFALLDSVENRYAILPGNAAKSSLIERIKSQDPDMQMPPPESNLHLTGYEIKLLERWIEQGAEWTKHWAFIPPKQAAVPDGAHPIDHFVQNKLKEKRLSPAPKASKEALLRRLSFDLTGLPPSTEALDAFLQNDAPDAYEQMVEQYLNSPHYGERMASIWLDVARYSDSHGYQDDRPRTMWPWRDWVIQAFNQNLPYDDFVTWQVAGDLLPNPTYEQKLATGFNRNHAITQEGGVVQEEYLTEYAADRAQTFSTAFLGLTMECARCHSHKYDPILQEEYYSLLGFFNNIEERGQISYFDLAPVPNMKTELPLMDSTIVQVRQMIEGLEKEQARYQSQAPPGFQHWSEKEFSKEKLKEGLHKGLLASFDLRQADRKEALRNKVQPNPEAFMNVNLPPTIEQPKWVSEKFGEAIQFDGSNFLTIGELGDFDKHHHFSFGGWIKHQGTHEKDAAIFGRRNGEQHQQGYDLVLQPDNRLAFRIIGSWYNTRRPPGEHDEALAVRTKARIPVKDWTHVFVTYDGSKKAAGVQLYIDGERKATETIIDQLGNRPILNGNDFLVGNWNHRARQRQHLYGFKDGAVSQLWLYDRTLSALEVQVLFDEASFNALPELQAEHYRSQIDPTFQALEQRLDSLRAIDLVIPNVMIMQELDTIKATFVLARGQYDAKLKQVNRGTPKAILPFSDSYPANRLGLTQWLFDAQHPLTARVFVNRIWQLYFGQGLVKTPEDFGNQGALPSHPELLDWLAVEFQQMDWDIKALIRLIVSSSSYQQSAKIEAGKYRKDPANKWLARGPNVRLSAEMLRDQALYSSGLYNPTLGGKWVKPYQPPGIWKALANQIGENKYRPSTGEALYRRSLYTYWKRTIPPPSMLTFDAAERSVCTVKRQATSTPLQSLVLMNDPQYVEAARVLAQKALLQHQEDIEAAIAEAFRALSSRTIKSEELQVLLAIYQTELQRFRENPESLTALLGIGEAPVSKEVEQLPLAALTVVANALFNLDEVKFK